MINDLLSPCTGIVREYHTFDVDDHAASLVDWNLSYDQLGRGRFEGQFTDIRLPGIQIFAESTSAPVRQRGTLSEDNIGFAFMTSSQGSGSLNGLSFDTNSMLACRATEIDLCTPEYFRLAGLVLDADLMDEAFQHCGFDSFPLEKNSVATLELKGSAAEHLRNVIRDTLDLAHSQHKQDDAVSTSIAIHWRDDLLEALADVMVETHPLGNTRRANERSRLVNQASQLMLSNALKGTTQSLGDVCRTVGTCARKLSYCFQEVVGMSALEYLRAVKFNAVRRELRQAKRSDTSIYDVATRHGFWHFGRFSVEYRQHFGERPSDTLRMLRSEAPSCRYA